MFGYSFFNDKPVEANIQALNLVAAGLAAFQLATDPDATYSEMGPRILIPVLTALSLQKNGGFFSRFCTSLLNAASIGAAYSGITSGSSAVDDTTNKFVLALHLFNTGSLLINAAESPIAVKP